MHNLLRDWNTLRYNALNNFVQNMAEITQQQKQSDSSPKRKMTTPFLPSELISKIVSFLPLPEVCRCMLVCKEWKELLSSEQFCKKYLLEHYNLTDEEMPSGHLKVWTTPDEWFHYWEDNADQSNAYVFSDPPKRWKCGIVHLADYMLGSDTDLKYKDLLKAVYILTRIQIAAVELDLDCGAWANEGTGEVETCLFPWNEDTLPTTEDIFTLFHFNPEMHNNPLFDDKEPESDEEDNNEDQNTEEGRGHVCWNTLGTSYDVDLQKANTFFDWLKQIFSTMVRIAIGCDAMNPVPCFILAKLSPGWVGGVLTSLALT